MPIRPLNRVLVAAVLAVAFFGVLVASTPMPQLIVILNGVFAGTAAAVGVAYWRLLWNAIKGVQPYDRVRQMTLGFVLCWLAYLLSVAISIYARSSGYSPDASVWMAASRYIAIIAAVLQVTAPDFGLGLFHGRDRKVLGIGVVLGFAVAVLVILSQTENALAEQGALSGQTAPTTAVGAGMGVPVAGRLDLPPSPLSFD